MGAVLQGVFTLAAAAIALMVLIGLVVVIEYVFRRLSHVLESSKEHDDVPTTERFAVLRRDRYACQICGARPSYVLHHVQPPDHGGAHTRENLITLCPGCHEEVESQRPSVSS